VWERPPANAPPEGPQPTIIEMNAVEAVEMHAPDQGRHHIAARWLVDRDLRGASNVIFGQCTFTAQSVHELHRHPGAGEALYAYAGTGVHLTEHGTLPQSAGELVLVPRGEWHGLRGSATGEPLRAVFILFGVADFDDAGYELHESSARTP